jgi:hypothetical protein
MPKKSTKKKCNFAIANFRESSLQYQAVCCFIEDFFNFRRNQLADFPVIMLVDNGWCRNLYHIPGTCFQENFIEGTKTIHILIDFAKCSYVTQQY